ncbi:MAG: nucleotidyltransferase domain-containing protein [Chloroflexi bacterium]|nr:nucleotidyltransferase domain-containing protein [Chloroflexota bacterium]
MNRQDAKSAKKKISKRTPAVREARAIYTAPRSFPWMPITDEKIQQAAQKIANAAHPEKIILFGSFAYGTPTPDSDVDFFVVMKSRKLIRKRMMDLSDILDPRPFPVDIITRTPAELTHRLEIGDCFFKEIVNKGKVLYERRTS